VRVCFDVGYEASLPEGHRFPMGKFAALHDILLRERLIREQDVVAPCEVAWDDLGLVHTRRYLDSLRLGTMDRKAERRMGLPRTDAIIRRSRLATMRLKGLPVALVLSGGYAENDEKTADLHAEVHRVAKDVFG
jgi:acetoin utilization deacetylase AcuC-like enzyme